MREYILVMVVAATVTYLLAGLCRLLAIKTNSLAQVRSRDVHTHAIPYFGGLAMLGGLGIALPLAVQMPFLSRQPAVAQDATAVFWAGLVICVVGLIDDKYDLPAFVKLGGQTLAAGIAVLGGVRLFWIPLPNRIFALDDATSILVTVLIITLCANAVNFVDGLDGLAAGVVAIGAAAFFGYTYWLAVEQGLTRASTASLLTITTVGICLGFLVHNFNPARMFMGDSGAMLLGLLMGMSAISFTGQIDPSALGAGSSHGLVTLLPILLPVAVLALPVIDLVTAYLRRTWRGDYWFVADKQHIHHRLLARGHSTKGAVFLMYAWTGVASVGLVVVAMVDQPITLWVVIMVVTLVSVLTFWPVRSSSQRVPIGVADNEALTAETVESDG